MLESKLPPLRCVGEDWYVYREGIWIKTRKFEFQPLALSIQHELSRTQRKATEVLKHVEFANQTMASNSDHSTLSKTEKSF
jgi:hypothetical protein